MVNFFLKLTQCIVLHKNRGKKIDSTDAWGDCMHPFQCSMFLNAGDAKLTPQWYYTYKINLTCLTFKLFAHRMRDKVWPPFVLQTVVINVYVLDCFLVSEGLPSMLSVAPKWLLWGKLTPFLLQPNLISVFFCSKILKRSTTFQSTNAIYLLINW